MIVAKVMVIQWYLGIWGAVGSPQGSMRVGRNCGGLRSPRSLCKDGPRICHTVHRLWYMAMKYLRNVKMCNLTIIPIHFLVPRLNPKIRSMDHRQCSMVKEHVLWTWSTLETNTWHEHLLFAEPCTTNTISSYSVYYSEGEEVGRSCFCCSEVGCASKFVTRRSVMCEQHRDCRYCWKCICPSSVWRSRHGWAVSN